MGRNPRKKHLKSAKARKTIAQPPKLTALDGDSGNVSISLEALGELGVEWWRLDRWALDVPDDRLVARHVARRLSRVLQAIGVEVVDLTGKPYDAGMAVEVLETISDPTKSAVGDAVGETVAPLVSLSGRIIRHGQVVVHRGMNQR
ncbi:MAG TPA: hypothetical protein VGM20_05650 [Gemmatimonadales bacterium]